MCNAYPSSSNSNVASAWNQRYATRRAYWRGPYDIAPIIENVYGGALMLDVGCGGGRYLVPLTRSGFNIIGVDVSNVALQALGNSYQLVTADLRNLPFGNSTFDAIMCYGVLHHLLYEGRQQAAKEVFRVLKSQGLTFVEVIGNGDMRYNHGDEVEAATFVRDGILHHHFADAELTTLLQGAGFTVVKMINKFAVKTYRGKKYRRHSIFAMIMKV